MATSSDIAEDNDVTILPFSQYGTGEVQFGSREGLEAMLHFVLIPLAPSCDGGVQVELPGRRRHEPGGQVKSHTDIS